jgi:nicotinamide riboside transporter PnuC
MDFLAKYFSDFSLLGMIVLILTIIAMYLLGLKEKFSYVIFTISQAIQIYIFYDKKQGFLILTMIILIVLNIVNYFKREKPHDPKNESRII